MDDNKELVENKELNVSDWLNDSARDARAAIAALPKWAQLALKTTTGHEQGGGV